MSDRLLDRGFPRAELSNGTSFMEHDGGFAFLSDMASERQVWMRFGSKFVDDEMTVFDVIDFPAHRTYVEPYSGAASMLLRKEPSEFEIINDLDGSIVSYFKVLRDQFQAAELIRLLELTPFSRQEYADACRLPPSEDPIENARRLYIRSAMGFSGLKPAVLSNGFRTSTTKNIASEWGRAGEALLAISKRLRHCIIEHKDALEVLRKYDGERTLFFVDPPYAHDSRTSNREYAHEMDDAQHEALAECLHRRIGNIILCGYACPLYDRLYEGWDRIEITNRNASQQECVDTLWLKINPPLDETVWG